MHGTIFWNQYYYKNCKPSKQLMFVISACSSKDVFILVEVEDGIILITRRQTNVALPPWSVLKLETSRV